MTSKAEPRRKRPRVEEDSADNVEPDAVNSKEEELEFTGPLFPEELSTKDFVLNGDHFIINSNVPVKHNYRLRWQERLGASCTPHTSFVYEIAYSVEIDDLFFQTQFQLLPYSPSRFDRYLTYTVIKSVLPPLVPIVQEGDILLRFNNNDMVIKDADADGARMGVGGMTPSTLMSNLTTHTTPKTLRLLRIACNNYCSMSVCEILMFLEEKTAAARFVCRAP
ncbi:hypothetical protein EON65_57160, partial [archaeon]